MEKFGISVTHNQQNYHLEVRDYMHHTDDQCKYEVYNDGLFIGSFEPDNHKYLHICKNPGVVDEGLLHLVADQLEGYHI